MDAVETFLTFVGKVLTPKNAARFAALAGTDKGQRKILASLDHKLEAGIRPEATTLKHSETLWNQSCFAYHRSVGFGTEFATVHQAYERLSETDGWLIVAADGSTGVYRPEARWDDEVQLTGLNQKRGQNGTASA